MTDFDDIAVTATRHMRRFRIVPAGFATFMDDLLQVARIKAWQCLMAGMPPNHAVADARSAAQDALRVERHGPSKRRTKTRMLTVEVAEHAIPITCREVARRG